MRKLFWLTTLLIVVVAAAAPLPVAGDVDHTCCIQAAAECEWRCTQGIRTFWCESEAYGPGTCAVQCDCWIWE